MGLNYETIYKTEKLITEIGLKNSSAKNVPKLRATTSLMFTSGQFAPKSVKNSIWNRL